MNSLFVYPDGSLKLSAFLVMAGIPLVFPMGRWILGFTLILVGFLAALLDAMDEIKEQEQKENRYENMVAEDILEELRALETDENLDSVQKRSDCLACLGALAKKCGRQQRIRKKKELKSKKSKRRDNEVATMRQNHNLECLCQDAAYFVLEQLYPSINDDEVLSAVLTLYALVAKDSKVRKRQLHEYDLYVLVEAIQSAMKRAQEDDQPDEAKERQSAELQRKGCLMLGALADGDVDMATKVVSEDGLQTVLDAVDWYRFHEEVAKWALWAIFILCFDHHANKAELVRSNGIQIICQTMKNVPDSKEVARHGIATLFDVLRQVSDRPTDVTKLRQIALAAGLQQIVRDAMEEFDDSIEIVMIGQELLVSTGYSGNIPQYQSIG